MSITIFLADDHGIVRDALRQLLEAQPDFIVVGEAAHGREAVQQITQTCPNLVILDLLMPELSGFEVIRQIHLVCPTTQILILSMYTTSSYILQALQAGAMGYLVKTSASRELAQAIRTVHSGQRYLSENIADPVLMTYLSQAKPVEYQGPLAQLSPREREILYLVVSGKSSAEIGRMLSLSPNSVDTYRSRLMQKLGLRDLPSLVKFAIRHGIISLE